MAPKKKPSKTDKDKQKKEELEKKAAEEENERLLRIEEERRLKKEKKLLEIEKQKLENEERKRRRFDMTQLTELLLNNRKILQVNDDMRRKEAKWARYLRCDGSPDPSISGEINTYISLKLENKERNDAESVLKDSDLDLKLIDELEFLLADTPLDDLPVNERERYRETISQLHDLIQKKLDGATLQVLCDASKLQDIETSNLQFVLKNKDIALCIWGNLSKNPRIKSFEFPDMGFSFDIPRILTLSDCAVRFLLTKFDHYSLYSKSYYPRIKMKKEEAEPIVLEAPPPAEEEEEKVVEEVKQPETEENAEKEEGMDIMALLAEEEKVEEEQEPQEQQVIEEDFEDPKTPEPCEWEDFDEDADVVDLRAYTVMGGVFCFDLLSLPPQPKMCKNWIITKLVDPPRLQFIDYVADTTGQEKAKEKEQEKDKRDEKPPINVSMNLPENTVFLEEPQVAWWDTNKLCWRTDGFSNYVYDEENRTFKFTASHFGTLCLLQDSHINMPFQSWELRPHKTNSAVLTIIAAILELEIQIKDSLCCLTQPERPELSHILNQWVTPRELISNLRKAGVNVFPAEDSSKFVTVQSKHPLVVERFYEEMGLVSSAIAFSWSKWNAAVEAENICVQCTEALRDEPLLEEDWALYMVSKRRFMRLKMTEFDTAFSDELQHNISYRSTLYHYMSEFTSTEAKERIQETTKEFADCVHQLLKATQVITYS